MPEKLYRSLDGVCSILDELAKKNSKDKAAQAEDFVDSSFVKKLDEKGFFDRLYKR